MTEQEWLACKSPELMIEFLLKGKTSDRKLRLFACSLFYGKHQFAHVADIVEVGVRMADGLALPEEIEKAWDRQAWDDLQVQEILLVVTEGIAEVFPGFFRYMFSAYLNQNIEDFHWVHENFGNPFRPISFDSNWRTEKVLALANTIYDKRAYDLMPILADELEEAGCESAEVLSHCRGGGPHVRGCWAVDVVLDKE